MKKKYLSPICAFDFHRNITLWRRSILSFLAIVEVNKGADHYGPSAVARNTPVFFIKKIRDCIILCGLIFSALLPATAFGHRGPIDEIDNCRIQVGSEWMHFTAYTPTFTEGKEYCQSIPHLGPTNLVFDYEGKGLRHVTVEFEITKEPEGTRIAYQEPKKIKTGTVDSVVDFSKFGAGSYLAHVTIVDGGNTLDTHLPFSVGIKEDSSSALMKFLPPLITGIVIFLVIFFLILSTRRKKNPAVISTEPTEK